MKLRNKKTGEIEEVCFAMSGGSIAVIVADMPLCGNSVLGEYDSLAELTEEWEDYNSLAELVEQAKAEARQNLSGEDLEKCYKALEAWARNTMTTVGWSK